MSKKEYWVWNTTKIDFDELPKDDIPGQFYSKADYIFHYLPLPDNLVHEWRNGEYSSEYNEALRYAEELGLIRWLINKSQLIELIKDVGLYHTVRELLKNEEYDKATALVGLYEDTVTSPLSDVDQEALLLDLVDHVETCDDFD